MQYRPGRSPQATFAVPCDMMDGDDALMISEALQEAMDIFQQGDDEVEADARAAGDL